MGTGTDTGTLVGSQDIVAGRDLGVLVVVVVFLAFLFREEPITFGLLALMGFLAIVLPPNVRVSGFFLALVFGLASNTLGMALTQNVLILPLWNENLRGALQCAGDISLVGVGLALLTRNPASFSGSPRGGEEVATP